MPRLLKVGINLTGLFNSKIFSLRIDYDSWPSTHSNIDTLIRPYNHSFFQIRHMYRIVFPEDEFAPLKNDSKGAKIDTQKIYKIKYSVNLLPQIGPHWVNHEKELKFSEKESLMEMIIDHEELEKYHTESL